MNGNQPRLLVIGATWEQTPLIQTARELGCYVLATDPAQAAEGLRFADDAAILDPKDLSHALEIARNFGPDGITADECDYSHYAAVYVAQRLGLPNDGLTAAQFTTNKLWMREQCQEYRVLQPRFMECRSPSDAESAVDIIGWPVIVKPVDNRGATGVTVARSIDELRQGYLDALRNSFARTVIVEAYIVGTHITVDGCVDQEGDHHNLALASKRVVSPENPLITEVNYPGEISSELADHIFRVNQQVVQALEIRAGLTHSEYIVDEKGRSFLVETANRGGGVLTSAKIVPEVSGVDLSQLLVRNALGSAFDVRVAESNRAVSLRFLSFAAGKVKAIRGLDTVRSLDGVLHLRLLVGAGFKLSEPRSGPERHGFALLSGRNLKEIDEIHRRILELIEVTYEES